MPSRSLSRSISRSRSPVSRSPSRSRSRSRSRGPAHRDDSRSPSPNRSNGRHPRDVDGEPYNHDQDADGDDPDREENQRKERELADRLKRSVSFMFRSLDLPFICSPLFSPFPLTSTTEEPRNLIEMDRKKKEVEVVQGGAKDVSFETFV